MKIYITMKSLFVFITSLSAATVSFACQIDAKGMNHIPQPITPEKGEWLLVQAWTLDCAVCEQQKPGLSLLNTKYDNLKVVNLSLDGVDNITAIRQRVTESNYSMNNFMMEPEVFQKTMNECFGKDYIGTPTYILYSPEAEVVVVRTGPFDLKTLPEQLKL